MRSNTSLIVALFVALVVFLSSVPPTTVEGKQAGRDPGKTARASDSSEQMGCLGDLEAGNKKFNKKDLSGAAVCYKKALTICPGSCAAFAGLGMCAFTLGDKSEALGWLEKAYACDPQDRAIAGLLGVVRRDYAVINKTPAPSPALRAPATPSPSGAPENYDGVYVGKECDVQGCAPLRVTIQSTKVEGTILGGAAEVKVVGTIDRASGVITTTYSGTLKMLGFSFPLRGECTGRASGGRAQGSCLGTDAFREPSTYSLVRQTQK